MTTVVSMLKRCCCPVELLCGGQWQDMFERPWMMYQGVCTVDKSHTWREYVFMDIRKFRSNGNAIPNMGELHYPSISYQNPMHCKHFVAWCLDLIGTPAVTLNWTILWTLPHFIVAQMPYLLSYTAGQPQKKLRDKQMKLLVRPKERLTRRPFNTTLLHNSLSCNDLIV